MKLLVLGASGGCGSWLVRLAHARGHAVTAFARPAAALDAPEGVAVVRGDVLDPRALDEAVAGQDAVISCVGQRRASRGPWSAPLSPPDLLARMIAALVPAMERRGVRRLVAISAGGVAESAAQATWPVRRLISAGGVAVAYRDLAAMEAALERSALDWLAVRPVTLVGGPPTGRAREVQRYGMLSTIRRADVAAYLLDAAQRPTLAQRRVMIGARG